MTKVSKLRKTLKYFYNDGVRKVLFVDFDGVFNPLYISGILKKEFYNPDRQARFSNPEYGETRTMFDGRRIKEPKSYEIRWSRELVENFNELLDESTQIIWLTTWRQYSSWIEETLEISPARKSFYLHWDYAGDSRVGKGEALVNYLSLSSRSLVESFRFVWIDDNAVSFFLKGIDEAYENYSDELMQTLREGLGTDNFLPVASTGSYGMSREELFKIENFLKS